MFTLADKNPFSADAEGCWLSAGYGYAEESFSWTLSLQSGTKQLRLGGQTGDASFGIYLHPPLGAKDWRDLRESPVELSPELLSCSFYFHFGCGGEWEDLLSLNLRFGGARNGQVEVWADGFGSVEAAPDLFLADQVEFQIHTWATFRGVAINVPLNASDAIAYSETRIRALLPRYVYSTPVLRKTDDDAGIVCAAEVLFTPHLSGA